jgi:hypothetical protein
MWGIVVHPRPWSDELDALASPLVVVHFWAIISLLTCSRPGVRRTR